MTSPSKTLITALMCGIVGYLGPQNPRDIIITGLKKLEYRGYDSAGLSILHRGEIKRMRASGKLCQLEAKVKAEEFDGHLGIGHTRWATHGIPSERNAHPHHVDGVSIVHNGIIENYADLREELKNQGAKFNSETDSEVVAHLIARELKVCGDLFKAVRNIVPFLQGAYAVLAIWEKDPETMVAFKNGPPLLIGLTESETIVASDVNAVLPYTKHVIYLDDDEIVCIRGIKREFFSANGFPIEKKSQIIDWDEECVEKQGFPHFMLKEIHEQPRAVAQAINPHINLAAVSVEPSRIGFGRPLADIDAISLEEDLLKTEEVLKKVERIFIIACGTSYYAGMYGEYLIENLAEIPVEVDFASEFRYRKPVVPPNSLIITISQSGETADTIAALRNVKEKGGICLSICNVKGSTIDREAHGHIYMNSGPEIGVASTKAFVSTLAVLNLIALYLGKTKGLINRDMEQEYLHALLAVPSQIEQVLGYDKFFSEAAETLKHYRGFLYLGRGANFPIALEGALKLKELAYMHAEGYAAGEMKHGPLALIDDRMVVVTVAPKDELYDKVISNLEEAKSRGGVIIAIGTGHDEKLEKISEHFLSLPQAFWTINPILAVVPMQLLAYHLADSLGNDVDQPRNLAKSVTVE